MAYTPNLLQNLKTGSTSAPTSDQTTNVNITTQTQTDHSSYVTCSFSIFYQNCRGLNSKVSDFLLSVLSADYDVIAITESWLTSAINSNELFGDSYSVYRCDRSSLNSLKERGGGVIIAVKNNFKSDRIILIGFENLELVIVKVKINHIIIIIICIYIPPNANIHIYDCVSEALRKVFYNYNLGINDKLIFLGDFNISSHSWLLHDDFPNVLVPIGTGSSSVFLDSIQTNGLFQINYIRNFMNRLLDLVFVNTYVDVMITKSDFPLVPIDRFHEPFEIVLKLHSLNMVPLEGTRRFYDFNNADFSSLNSFFKNVSWHSMFTNSSLSTVVSDLHELFSISFDLFVPVKTRKTIIHNNHPVWFNRRILGLKNRKNKAFKRKSIDPITYISLRQQFKETLKTAYLNYIKQIEQNLIEEPQRFWSFVNSTRKSKSLPSSMFLDSDVANSVPECCDLFKSHFSNVYIQDDPITAPLDFDFTLREHLPIGNIVFTPHDVLIALLNLNIKKGAGPDKVPAIFLINCAQSLATPLCIIFNMSLSCGTFPEIWKSAFIKPIYKSGSRNDIKNYRGISISSTIPKLFECLVTNALTAHFASYVSPCQHAYLKGRSTITNLIEFVHTANSTLYMNYQLDVIYTDFSKAFDRVNHKVLIKKLEKIGIHSALLSWIQSFLVNRSQCVKLFNFVSSPLFVTSGVPQGSHIGPLLFILFINDLVQSLTFCKCLIYADDVKLFYRVNCLVDMSRFQRDLNSFSRWCLHNRLTLNINKCKHVSYFRNKPCFHSHYHFNNERIETLLSIKDLGVLFRNNLSFDHHIDVVVSKANSMLGFVMRSCKYFSNLTALKAVYFAHVRSHLEYANIIWNPHTANQSNRIESIQKKFILYVLRRRYPRYLFNEMPPYTFRCDLLEIPLLSVRRKLSYLLFLFDILSGNIDAPNILSEINFNVPSRILRHNITYFRIPFLRNNFGLSDPIISMCSLFNQVNDSIGFSFDFDHTRFVFYSMASSALSSV